MSRRTGTTRMLCTRLFVPASLRGTSARRRALRRAVAQLDPRHAQEFVVVSIFFFIVLSRVHRGLTKAFAPGGGGCIVYSANGGDERACACAHDELMRITTERRRASLTNDERDTPKRAVIALMRGAVPEREEELMALWARYNPDVVLVADARRVTLNATKDRIAFDAKTMDVFWLIAFSGWRAIECYSPHVILSAANGKTVAEVILADAELDEVERAYREKRAAAETLVGAPDLASAPWPDDLPQPSANRNALDDAQYQAVYDLACLAAAFTLYHEFHHAMLDRDNQRPSDPREEEMLCDVWARNFMTAKAACYAKDNGHSYHDVLRKRSMGLAIAALILHDITPVWDQGGNRYYFSIGDRLRDPRQHATA